jgi:hypothetical protein
MSPLALKLGFFLGLMGVALGMAYWAVEVSGKPKEMTSQVVSAIEPAKELLLGNEPLMALKMSSQGQSITFALRPNGWWWMIEPERTMARQAIIQQWVGALTKPKLMRVLQKNEWNPTNLTQSIELELVSSHTTALVRYMRLEAQPQFYYLQLSNGVVLKAEDLVTLHWFDKTSDWRTRRLWPFELEAVEKMIYKQNSTQREWLNTETGWTCSGRPPMDNWKLYFKAWDNLGCQAYIEALPKDGMVALAQWEFTFASGDQALLELFKTEYGEWLVSFRGRDMGQLLTLETVQQAFPEGPWQSSTK